MHAIAARSRGRRGERRAGQQANHGTFVARATQTSTQRQRSTPALVSLITVCSPPALTFVLYILFKMRTLALSSFQQLPRQSHQLPFHLIIVHRPHRGEFLLSFFFSSFVVVGLLLFSTRPKHRRLRSSEVAKWRGGETKTKKNKSGDCVI